MCCFKRVCFVLCMIVAVPSVLPSLKDAKLFIKNALKNPSVVGAVLPCSHGVGVELMRYVLHSQEEHPDRPLRILEIGAGTGPMSEVIVSHMRGIDHVDLIEISPDFCRVLHEKFDRYPNVSVRCLSIIDWHPTEQYDFIISTLPFNSFEYDLMNDIINHISKLVKPNGVVSYVAYLGMSSLIKNFTWGEKKKNHAKKMKRLEQWRANRLITKKTVLKNVPPINIYHLQFK